MKHTPPRSGEPGWRYELNLVTVLRRKEAASVSSTLPQISALREIRCLGLEAIQA